MPNSAGMVTAITANATNRNTPSFGSLSIASPVISTANSEYSATACISTGIASAGIAQHAHELAAGLVQIGAHQRPAAERRQSVAISSARVFMRPPA